MNRKIFPTPSPSQPGSSRRVATGDTSRDTPRVISLNAGRYDIKTFYRKTKPEQERSLVNVNIVQGQRTGSQVDYQHGTLSIQATSGGKTTRSSLTFSRPGESRRLATGNGAKLIMMEPESYEVVVRGYKRKR